MARGRDEPDRADRRPDDATMQNKMAVISEQLGKNEVENQMFKRFGLRCVRDINMN